MMLAWASIAGGVVSTTVTVNDPDADALASSVTVQLTVVGPSGNVAPDVAEQTAVIGPCSASLPIALNIAVAPDGPVASLTMLAGAVNVGAVFVMLMVNEPDAVAPATSVTVHATVVVPIGKGLAERVWQSAVRGPSSTSLPSAVEVTARPAGVVAGDERLFGAVNLGAVLVTRPVDGPRVD